MFRANVHNSSTENVDQFANFEVRGDRFRDLVRDLLDGDGTGDRRAS